MNKTLLRAALAGAAFTFALPAAAASEVTYTFDWRLRAGCVDQPLQSQRR